MENGLIISKSGVLNFPLTCSEEFSKLHPNFLAINYYKLLAYLSTKVSGHISDIGTYQGLSAYALATNKNNYVLSIDINDRRSPYVVETENLTFSTAGWEEHVNSQLP